MFRIGFDMDGTLADFRAAFREVEVRLFGPQPALGDDQPEREEAAQAAGSPLEPDGSPPEPAGPPPTEADSPADTRRRRRSVWKAIQATPDFWRTLEPMDPLAVARIHRLMLLHRWEVFFITQRPRTVGDTVQRQTQKWLVEQGFDLPSVLVLGGSRGAAAAALRLDYHVDDSMQNCIDVISDASARPLLVAGHADPAEVSSARALGISTVGSIGEAVDILEKATIARATPGLLDRLAAMVGWR